MNAQKLTKKAMEAVTAAQNIALENQNMQIMPEHLLYALADQEGGLIPSLLKKSGADIDLLLARLDTAIGKIPAVSGSGREPDKIYISPVTDKIFAQAERLAANMKDEYVSVEHIMLALFDYATEDIKQIFRDLSVTKEKFLAELKKVKSERVTSDDPESTYDALTKYGFDLVQRAKEQKLDPVIGARQRDTKRYPHFVAQIQKQSRAHRRTGASARLPSRRGLRKGSCGATFPKD